TSCPWRCRRTRVGKPGKGQVDREIGGGGIAATVRAPLGGAARAQAMTVAGIRSMAARETAAMARLRAIARPCAALKRRRCPAHTYRARHSRVDTRLG